MPGLELIGPIAGKPQVLANDEVTQGIEEMGLFVAGDISTIRSYSGMDLGWRWLARAQGPLVDRVGNFPQGPEGGTFAYFKTEEEARAFYGACRNHALQSTPGLQAEDTRKNFPLNAPNAYAESFWHQGQEVLRLIYDRMADLQVFARNTDCIDVFDASPRSAPAPDGGPHPSKLVSYYSQNEILFVAIARGATGAAEHVVITFSDEMQPVPVITDGLPRAEWMRKIDKLKLAFPSNVMILQWGRMSGLDALSGEDRQNPIASLWPKFQRGPAVPLAAPPALAERLPYSPQAPPGPGNIPAAYAIRLEPGAYTVTYLELMGTPTGGYSCCAISRDGAPSFMPAVLGNAGGIVHGGLTVEQYAMLSVERDNFIMQNGGMSVMSPQMGQICAKYGVPFSPGGMAGRVQGWELMIQGDASFSSQWAIHRGVATMRLQGIEPTAEQIAAMGQQQQAVTASLEANHKRHMDKKAASRQAALAIIQFSFGKTPEQVIAELQRIEPNVTPNDILFDAMRILRKPGEGGNPRFDGVDKRLEVLVKARWSVMDEEGRKFEGGKLEKFHRSEMDDIYPPNDLKLPGLMGWLGRL